MICHWLNLLQSINSQIYLELWEFTKRSLSSLQFQDYTSTILKPALLPSRPFLPSLRTLLIPAFKEGIDYTHIREPW